MKKLWFIILLCCCACTPISKQQETFLPVMKQNIIYRNQLDITSTYYRSSDMPSYFMIRYDQLATFPNKAKQEQINNLITSLVESFSFAGIPKYSGVIPLVTDHPVNQIVVNASIESAYNDLLILSLDKQVQLKDGYYIEDYANHCINLKTGKELTLNELLQSNFATNDLNRLLQSALDYVDPFEMGEKSHLYNAPFHKAFEGLEPGFSLLINPDSLHVILNDSCNSCYFPLTYSHIRPHIISIYDYTPVVFDRYFQLDRSKYATEGSYEFLFHRQTRDFNDQESFEESLVTGGDLLIRGYYPKDANSFWLDQKIKMKQVLFDDIQKKFLPDIDRYSMYIHMNLNETSCINTLYADYYIYNAVESYTKRFIFQYRSDTNETLQLKDLFKRDFDYKTFIRKRWELEKNIQSSNWNIDAIMESEAYFMIYPWAIEVYAYYDDNSKEIEAKTSFTIDDFGIENLADFIRNPNTQ